MGPVESASCRLLPFRFPGKTFACPLAVIRGFVPVDVGDGKFLFPLWDLAFGPMPGRPGALCLDKFGVVRVRYFVLVDIEGIQINVIGVAVAPLFSPPGVTCKPSDLESPRPPDIACGDWYTMP